MHRVWVVLAALVWCVTITASGAMNAVAGYRFGQTHWDGIALASLAVAADLWKAIGPIFIASLFFAGRKTITALATITWVTCFLFAVSSAIGFAGTNRAVVSGGKENLRLALAARENELAHLLKVIESASDHRSSREIEAAIDSVMTRAVANRGTVGRISNGCRRDDAATRSACEEVAQQRQALVRSQEREKEFARSKELRSEIERLRFATGHVESDVQSDLIARLMGGRLVHRDVALGLVLLLVTMVELISSFGPVILRAYVAANSEQRSTQDTDDVSRTDATSRDTANTAATKRDIISFLSTSIAPSVDGRVEVAHLYGRYVAWCERTRAQSSGYGAFDNALNEIGRDLLHGAVTREGEWLCGLKLKAQ